MCESGEVGGLNLRCRLSSAIVNAVVNPIVNAVVNPIVNAIVNAAVNSLIIFIVISPVLSTPNALHTPIPSKNFSRQLLPFRLP
jgi:hypothetical protein